MKRIDKKALIAVKDNLVLIFENNRQFLQVLATVSATAAGWWTFKARQRHHKKLETQIKGINTEIKKEKYITRRKLFKYGIYVLLTGATIGYFIGFRHGKMFYRIPNTINGRVKKTSFKKYDI